MVKDSNGFLSFSDSADFFSTETELEVLGLAPVSEGVLKLAEGEAVLEASEIVGVETEVGKTFSSADDTDTGADRLVEAEMLDPNDDVVEVVEASAIDETAVVVLLSVMTVVVETEVELSEFADSVDAAAADEVDAAVEAVAGIWVVFLATTALYCCISITAASSNTWAGTIISYSSERRRTLPGCFEDSGFGPQQQYVPDPPWQPTLQLRDPQSWVEALVEGW